MIQYWAKLLIRELEAKFSFRKVDYPLSFGRFQAYQTYSWPSIPVSEAEIELAPYFSSLGGVNPSCIVDMGAAVGLFSVPALLRWPQACVFAFEPGRRQQILLKRNAQLNGVGERLFIQPIGCWDKDGELEYRSHSAIGGFKGVAQLPRGIAYPERVLVKRFDSWWKEKGRPKIDIVKMDIEGAEVEALLGMVDFLNSECPLLLIEAYHTRNGARTYGWVAEYLQKLEFLLNDIHAEKGLIIASKIR